MKRRVLYIAYQYPPVGGAGVQRTAKFVRYLPRHGWVPTVLTVANPSVPVLDASLGEGIPDEVVTRRTRTFEPPYRLKATVGVRAPGSGAGASAAVRRLPARLARRAAATVLQPDAQVLWAPGAARAGLALLRDTPHDAIIATGPPFSSFLAGAHLARRSGLPLLLDYRDEWDLSNAHLENRRLDPVSRLLQCRMQRWAIRRASVLVATTRSSARALEAVRDAASSGARVSWIYNGYDGEDFEGADGPAAAPHPVTYRLAYVGTLWNLTSIAPLVGAILRLSASHPDLARGLELTVAGRRTAPQQAVLRRLDATPCVVVERDYLDHASAVSLLRNADGLCVLLADLPGAARVVPAKVFELMAARRPILAVAPRGELWDLLEGYPHARRHEPADVEGIAASLRDAVEGHRRQDFPSFEGWGGCPHDRVSQARRLAELLDSVSCPHPGLVSRPTDDDPARREA